MSPMFLSRASRNTVPVLPTAVAQPTAPSERHLHFSRTKPDLSRLTGKKIDWDDICNKLQALSLLENQIEKFIDVVKQLD